MTVQQEVQKRASYLSDEQAKVILMLFDNFNIENNSFEKKEKNKDKILQTAGKIDIDADAVNELRRISVI